jgi:signal transduction histidine kinase
MRLGSLWRQPVCKGLPRFVGTITFKLAMAQAALFAVSAAILFAAIYWTTIGFATTQLKGEIAAEAAVFTEERSSDGLAELVKTIDFRTHHRGAEGRAYLLRGPDGQTLAGGLAPAEVKPGWQTLAPGSDPSPSSDDEPHAIVAFGQTLPSGEFLVVGHDIRDIDAIKELITQTFAWAAAVTLVLALFGGTLTSLGFLRSVEIINATTRRIMAGDLHERVPVKGTGDEFDRLAANLNGMLERIESLMEGLRQVSSDIAHDLRTPLTHLRQRLEQTRSGPQTKEAYEAIVEATIEDTDTILKMFAALLRIAQIEAGTRRGGFADVDLSKVFTAIVDIYGPVAEDNGQSLTDAIAPDIHLRGDRELLTQMLANLVENAIRYGGAGARIGMTLSATSRGPHAVISDTGPGIEPHMRDKVFRRFFRAETHRVSEGSGLGLALVRAVADLHDIEIRLSDNSPGLRVELAFSSPPAMGQARIGAAVSRP